MVTLRPAGADDARLLYEWANDPLTRQMARNPEPIAWAEHAAWFSGKLADDGARLWIAEADGAPVGQVRLDREDKVAEIDVSVAPDRRGQGFGTAILAALSPRHLPQVRRAVAAVRVANHASAVAFRRAGFRETHIDGDYLGFAKEFPDG